MSKPSKATFTDHRVAAMTLITSGAGFTWREGQFLGGLAFGSKQLTPKQMNWLRILLERRGLPPLVIARDE